MIDRSGWPHGPWDNEVDEYAWEWKGISCMIIRRPGGYLCGYVAVPDGVVFSGDERHALDTAAHGGITFEGQLKCASGLVWVGFDCFHGGDDSTPDGWSDGMYRDVEYVRARVNRMAEIALNALSGACGVDLANAAAKEDQT